MTESSGGRGTSDEENRRVCRKGGGNWKGCLKIHPCFTHAYTVPYSFSLLVRLSFTFLFSLPSTRLRSFPRFTSLAHLLSRRFILDRLFSSSLSLSLSLFLLITLRRRTRGSLGSLRAFITGHYFPGMLLTVTLRNDKLICSRSGLGGKVYHAKEGSAHVFMDGESYRVCGKIQSRGGSILPTKTRVFRRCYVSIFSLEFAAPWMD